MLHRKIWFLEKNNFHLTTIFITNSTKHTEQLYQKLIFLLTFSAVERGFCLFPHIENIPSHDYYSYMINESLASYMPFRSAKFSRDSQIYYRSHKIAEHFSYLLHSSHSFWVYDADCLCNSVNYCHLIISFHILSACQRFIKYRSSTLSSFFAQVMSRSRNVILGIYKYCVVQQRVPVYFMKINLQ